MNPQHGEIALRQAVHTLARADDARIRAEAIRALLAAITELVGLRREVAQLRDEIAHWERSHALTGAELAEREAEIAALRDFVEQVAGATFPGLLAAESEAQDVLIALDRKEGR